MGLISLIPSSTLNSRTFVRLDTPLNFPAFTNVPIPWDTVSEDTDECYSNTAPTFLTIKKSGVYLIDVSVAVPGGGLNLLGMLFGGGVRIKNFKTTGTSSGINAVGGTASWRFTAGAQLTFQVQSNVAVTSTLPSVQINYLSLQRILD